VFCESCRLTRVVNLQRESKNGLEEIEMVVKKFEPMRKIVAIWKKLHLGEDK
jgi:hypothetical protein